VTPTSASRPPAPYRRPFFRVRRYTSELPKVVCLCDSSVIPEALHVVLEGRAGIVATTSSGNAAVALSELLVPDVVVVSEMLADGVAESFVPAILRVGSRVLMICEPRETAGLVELVALGVTGLVGTDQTPQELAEAVLELAAGGAELPPDVVAAVVADWRRGRRRGGGDTRSAQLTARERDVLDAISDGLSAKAVAHHLGIAVKTVEHHKSRIFDKLGVRTQAEAVAVALGTADEADTIDTGAAGDAGDAVASGRSAS
jgi:DNA-binding NarL/FixJ family response regulator